MNSAIAHVLRYVLLTGGCQADRDVIRSALGARALVVDAELKLVRLGCADADAVSRIAEVAETAAPR